jgi:glutamyl-Q tRNA(Asp) synthetase
LAWLGLAWEEPTRRQSEHMADYAQGLDRLDRLGLLYPCFCTRKEIRAEIASAARAPHGPEGPIYPGTCRSLSEDERRDRKAAGTAYALRLDMAAAVTRTGPLSWIDRAAGEIAAEPLALGDVVLARKEVATSYHLSVTLDDALQGVTLVTRGADLFHASHVHRLLQALLGLPVPEWHHHGLLTDETGERLAKRADAASIRALRDAGKSPAEVRALAGFPD